MTYTYQGTRSHMESLRIRQQIEAANIQKAERELHEIQDIETDLARLQRRRESIADQLKQARERTTTARKQLTLPPPVYGGREGLEAAAREAHGWWKRKNSQKAITS